MTPQRSQSCDGRSSNETFYCKNRQSTVEVLFCLNSFVDVNALNVRDSQCFKCSQGGRIRTDFASA